MPLGFQSIGLDGCYVSWILILQIALYEFLLLKVNTIYYICKKVRMKRIYLYIKQNNNLKNVMSAKK